MVDFIFVINELFRYLLRLRRYERKLVEVVVFRRGWVTLSANFREKGASPTNYCWCQKTSDCRIVWYQNIRSALFSFVTIHASDGQTDGQTDRRTETELRQQYRALHYMQSHGKNGLSVAKKLKRK